VQVSYDALYRPTGIADGKNNITTFGYNEVGFPSMTTYPLGDTFRWYYAPVNQQTAWWGTDKEDNPVARVDANGILTRFVRSTDDSRLLRMEYYTNPADPNSLITTQTVYVDYDEFNRVRQLQNGEAQLEYTYDDNNLPLTVTTTYPAPVGSKTILYQYYPDGSRKSMTVPGVGTFSYIYEYTTGSSPMRVSGLRVRVVCPWTPHPNIDCNYDQAGRLRRETNGGVRTDYDYYPRGLLSRQVSFYGPGTLASAFAQFDMGYQPSLPGIFYDALGNRTGMYVTVPPYGSALGIAGRVDYLYDARDRLIRETFTLANNMFWYDDAYSYDDADNATAIHGQVFTHNANNQVTGAGFRYDGNGNATLFRTLALGFDVENRIVQLPDLYRRGNNVIAAGYRPDGMQAWRQDADGRVYFLYDGGRLVAEYSAANGNLLQHFAYSAEGLNQRRGNQHRLFTFDPDGNLVHRLTAGSVSPLSITWHNRTGVVYQDQLASTGALVDVPNAGTVGYQGYWGVYSDASTRTMGQGRFAALVTLNAGGYFDPLTAHGMRRDFATLNPYARLYRPESSLANRVTNLVISWADAGWTAGDPAAAPGAALAKAVSALRRTVDAAWEIHAIASLPRALGALGVGILNAADDLAGGRLSIPKILDIIADDIRSHKSLQHLRKTAPETLVELYHYTSGEAARNILASGLIRGGRPGLWRPWAAGDVYFSVYPNAPKWLLQGVYGLPPTKTQVIVPARVPVRDVLWRPFGIRIVHGSIDITAGY
jgi:YD repeat-containing protein